MMKRTMTQAIAALLASTAAAMGATPDVPDTGATRLSRVQ
jgi:hypothetical protein